MVGTTEQGTAASVQEVTWEKVSVTVPPLGGRWPQVLRSLVLGGDVFGRRTAARGAIQGIRDSHCTGPSRTIAASVADTDTFLSKPFVAAGPKTGLRWPRTAAIL